MSKLFEVRRVHNDVTFVDAFLTEEFAARHKLFTYKYDRKANQYQIASREFRAIKQQLLFGLTNHGQPFVYVVDANHANRGELFLMHRHEGIDLRVDWAQDTLKNIQAIWGRPVHIQTEVDGKGKIYSFDGTDHSESDTAEVVEAGSSAD